MGNEEEKEAGWRNAGSLKDEIRMSGPDDDFHGALFWYESGRDETIRILRERGLLSELGTEIVKRDFGSNGR